MFTEQKNELELMAQIQEQRRMSLRNRREQGGERSQVRLSQGGGNLFMFEGTKGVNPKYDPTHRPFSPERYYKSPVTVGETLHRCVV